jgi:anaerobic magnesium-protoporphyrin IX monomethyl ester cyclase
MIVLGGPHISAFGAAALETAPADAAVAGEGERSMEMLVAARLGGGDLASIPGLFWRDADGTVVVNPGTAPIVEDVDTIPMPAYDLIDPTRYWHRQSMPPIPRRRYISLVSSRGCPYGCMWCHNIFGRGFRAHSPERIIEEIALYKKKYGVDDIEFLDDCFNLQRQRVFDFSEQLLKKEGRIKIAFPNALRADLLDADSVNALADAGAYFSSFALESASERIQELTSKRLNIAKFLEAVRLSAARGIFTNGFMMIGFPSETVEEMELTIKTAAESDLHTASFFTVTPFPGTPLFDYVREHLADRVSHINYSEMDFCQMRINLSNVSDKTLYYYQRKATRDFFLRPGRLYRILRDFPQPHLLPLYVPIVLNRAFKGVFSRDAH